MKDQLRDQISVSSTLNARINALEKEIEEKNEEILSFQTLNHILAARDFKSNEELQNCRRDLIDVTFHFPHFASLIKDYPSLPLVILVMFSLSMRKSIQGAESNTVMIFLPCRACKTC